MVKFKNQDLVTLKNGNFGVVFGHALCDADSVVVYEYSAEGALGARNYQKSDVSLVTSPAPHQLATVNGPISHLRGSDPEIFVFSEGKLLPAFKFLPEERLVKSKSPDNPHPYFDGFQAEFSMPAAACHDTLVANFFSKLKQLRSAAVASGAPNITLVPKDVVEVSLEELSQAIGNAADLGCSPSENAYGATYEPLVIPEPHKHPLRYAGCHLHFSQYSDLSSIPQLSRTHLLPSISPDNIAKVMDQILGVALTALGRDLEDPRRRQAYGRPGEYRIPGPYRFEYRTPSNFILWNPALVHFALDLGRWAFSLAHFFTPKTLGLEEERARKIIETCDADEAVKYISTYSQLYSTLFARCWGYRYHAKTFKLLEVGAKASRLTGDLEKRWDLDKSYSDKHCYDFRMYALLATL